MTEAMSPEREAEVRAQRTRVQCLKPQPCADRYCTRHGHEGATIDGLLALVSAEREARQRAEKLAADAAEDCSQWKRVALETQTELLDALSSAGLTAIATAIARAERAEAEAKALLPEVLGMSASIEEARVRAREAGITGSLPMIVTFLIARADTAEAAYSALREAVESFAHVVHGGRPQSTASHRLASVLASTPASLAASYRERLRDEAIEECAKECEAKAVDMRGLMHGLWLSSGADECAARLRSLASFPDPK
jgi:hypothetical protein